MNTPAQPEARRPRWRRFADWSLRVKVAILLVLVTLVPLVVGAMLEIRNAGRLSLASARALLEARGDQLARELDTFARGFRDATARLARFPAIVALEEGPEESAARRVADARALVDVWAASTPTARGVGILDASGVVRVATDRALEGKSLAYHPYVRDVLRGAAVVSDVHLAEPEVHRDATIAFASPVHGGTGELLGATVVWVRAASLWTLAKAANGLAGEDSFAVLFDQNGIRIAHTYIDEIVFRPGGALDPDVIARAVAEERFGEDTARILADVRASPEQFERARAASPSTSLFRGVAPGNGRWCYGVARRLELAPWTLFYMIPEASIHAPIEDATREQALVAAALIAAALAVGALFASVLLRPIRALARATAALGAGDLSARVEPRGRDEIGRLGASFNTMAARIQEQSSNLERARDELEARVAERTAALQESEEYLHATLDSIGDAVIAADARGRVVRLNPVAERLTGWSSSEAKGKALADVLRVVVDDVRASAPDPLERALAGGATVARPHHAALAARDGTARSIAETVAPIRDGSGAVRGAVVVFRDETEERRAERALRVSEARFRRLTESGVIGIVLADTNGNIHEANDAFLDMVGYTREDLLAGRVHATTLNTPDGGEAKERARAQLLEHGVAQPWEKEFLRKDGTRVPVLIGVTMLDPPNCLNVVLDLSALKRAEDDVRRLREQREADAKFQGLLEGAPDAMVVVDQAGHIVLVNAETERLFGYRREELVGQAIELLVPARLRGAHVHERRAYLEHPKARRMRAGLETVALRKDGTEVPVEISLSPLKTEQGTLVSSAIRDITERREIERTLFEANRMKSEFLANMSHELRTPLNAIIGFADLMHKGKVGPVSATHQEYLDDILTSSRHLLQLINDVLDLAKVESGKIEFRPETVDVARLISDVRDVLRGLSSQKRLGIHVEVDPAVSSVVVDPSRLKQVLYNYLSNAIKFTAEHGHIRIRVAPEGPDRFRVAVQDSGIGIRAEDLSKLFREFHQLDGSTGKRYQGTGLGLVLTKRIVEAHGGTVEVESEPGRGSTFSAVFPRRPSRAD